MHIEIREKLEDFRDLLWRREFLKSYGENLYKSSKNDKKPYENGIICILDKIVIVYAVSIEDSQYATIRTDLKEIKQLRIQ